MDCEGAEYDIINGSDNKLLRLFKSIVIEYHYGYIDLKKKLEGVGFKVKCEKQIYYFSSNKMNKNMYVGNLIAEKFL